VFAIGPTRAAGIETTTVAEMQLRGSTDFEVFAAATFGGYVLLPENVGDFTRIAAEHSTGGAHHGGLLIALSSRFSRRAAGAKPLRQAIAAIRDEDLCDRVVYPQPTSE
jgi:hypothetical protein